MVKWFEVWANCRYTILPVEARNSLTLRMCAYLGTCKAHRVCGAVGLKRTLVSENLQKIRFSTKTPRLTTRFSAVQVNNCGCGIQPLNLQSAVGSAVKKRAARALAWTLHRGMAYCPDAKWKVSLSDECAFKIFESGSHLCDKIDSDEARSNNKVG